MNPEQYALYMARNMNYKLHAECLSVPILKGLSVTENNNPQIILYAVRDGIIEQLVSDGNVKDDEIDERIDLVIKNTKEYMKNNNYYDVENSFIYYKDYNNGVFNFKIYVQDMIRLNDGKKSVIRNLHAYFIEPIMHDFYQFSITGGPYDKVKTGIIDCENDYITKTLNDMMMALLKELKYKSNNYNKKIANNNYLKREQLAKEFYGYHSKNNISNNNDTLNYLNLIRKYLNSYEYKSNDNFVMCGRKKIVYDEILKVLNGEQLENDPLYFILGSLEEFMLNNNSVYASEAYYSEIRRMNDEYIKTGYICSEEKEYIDDIISKIENYISGGNNN